MQHETRHLDECIYNVCTYVYVYIKKKEDVYFVKRKSKHGYDVVRELLFQGDKECPKEM